MESDRNQERLMAGSLILENREWLLEENEDFSDLPLDIRRMLVAWFDPQVDELSFMTSGSTGEPKSVRHAKSAMRESAIRTGEALELGRGTRAWWVLPPHFIGGAMMLIRAIVLEWQLHAGTPQSKLKVPPSGMDFCACTPMQLRSSGGLPGVSKLLLGGSPVNGPLPLHGIGRVWEGFGMTETISHIALRELKPIQEEAFQCVRGVAVREDEEGCLIVQAPHLTIEEIRTRDQVKCWTSGSFEWLGRQDHVINSGGIKVHPEQVEKAIHDLIKRPFVVTSRAHAVLGQEVILVVDPRGGSGDVSSVMGDERSERKGWKGEAVKNWLEATRRVLPKHHAPRAVVWMELNQTPTGKWIRPRL
jgi:O-succinylbenzoic acid--CoA ligase